MTFPNPIKEGDVITLAGQQMTEIEAFRQYMLLGKLLGFSMRIPRDTPIRKKNPLAKRNAKIREEWKAGGMTNKLAKKYGITTGRIHSIIYPGRHRARTLLHEHVKRGVVKRPDACEKCGGNNKIQAHHPNYEDPLNVNWLCAPCHAAEHRRLRQLKEEITA